MLNLFSVPRKMNQLKVLKVLPPLCGLWLWHHPWFICNYVHEALLDVTKLFLSLRFDPSQKAKEFSIFENLNLVDKRLLSMKPPNHITNAPRSMKSHLCYWKASKYRSFLLYLVPVLYGCLIFNWNTFTFWGIQFISFLNQTWFQKTPLPLNVFFSYLKEPTVVATRQWTFILFSILLTVLKRSLVYYIFTAFFILNGTQNISKQLANVVSSAEFVPPNLSCLLTNMHISPIMLCLFPLWRYQNILFVHDVLQRKREEIQPLFTHHQI